MVEIEKNTEQATHIQEHKTVKSNRKGWKIFIVVNLVYLVIVLLVFSILFIRLHGIPWIN